MKLVVGLGNPEEKYFKTRHNVGYMAVEKFADNEKLKFKYDPKFMGLVAEYYKEGNKAYILKPVTYMNLSGRSVVKLVNYYNIKLEDILIIYDDVDIDLGSLKLKPSGSSGGHKGILDIINQLNTENIKRIKVGIGKDEHMIKHVLSKFSRKERKIIDPILDDVNDVIERFVKGEDFSLTMNQFNRR